MLPHHLVLQSPTLSATHYEQGAILSQAQGRYSLSPTAIRLLHVQHDTTTRTLIHRWSEKNGIDYAFIPTGSQLTHCKVLALDMDATLINIECIDELAKIAGVQDQVAALTAAAMHEENVDFAASLRRRVALLADLPAQALERVYTQRLQLNPGAETLIARAQQAGLKVLLLSGGFTFFTHRLRAQLNLDDAAANVLEIEAGRLTGRLQGDIIDAAGKAERLRLFAQQQRARSEHIIAIGDGANDLQMLAAADFSVAYHAKPIVRRHAHFALNVCGLDGVLNWFEN
jgi:phosphoserine phosphatase